MLTLNNLRSYSEHAKQHLPAVNRLEIIISKDDLTGFLAEHKKAQNILMVAVFPDHTMGGGAGAAQWENVCGFFFITKTDYSALKNNDEYLNLFAETQLVAKAFVELLLTDKADNYNCGFLAHLDEGSIGVHPIKALSQCNGHFVQFAFKSKP